MCAAAVQARSFECNKIWGQPTLALKVKLVKAYRMNDSCTRGIPPGGRAAAVLGARQQPVPALPGLAGPAEQTEGRAMPWRGLCSVKL